MVDFERARAQMVENQLRSGGVTNVSILAGIRAVPRERFVAEDRRELAYIDAVQWFGESGPARRFMTAPVTLAKLLKLADIQPHETVLDVGAASGYSTAVISSLASTVVGIEQDSALAAAASSNLAALGLSNASVIEARFDAPPGSGFDVILIQGAVDAVPQQYLSAVKDGGRVIALVRAGATAIAHVFIKTGKKVAARADFNASLPTLLVSGNNEEFVF